MKLYKTEAWRFHIFLWWLNSCCLLLEKTISSQLKLRQLAQEYKVFHSGVQAALEEYVVNKSQDTQFHSSHDFFVKLWDSIFLLDCYYKEYQEVQAYNQIYEIVSILHQGVANIKA